MNIRTLLLLLLCPAVAQAGELTLVPVMVSDYKPVFATMESVDVVNARARIGGTVIDLMVDEGAEVKQGQVIAVIGDDKLALQLGSLDAQIAAAEAQQAKAQEDFSRAQELFRNGTVARAKLNEMRAAFQVADNQLRAVSAQRSVIDQQVREGQILSPAAGRVLEVPVTRGAVLMPGEVAARIAAASYILRLELPERHAGALKVGDTVQLEDGRTGAIRQVYPEISGGRVRADADVPDAGGYFVGQRIRVRVSLGMHQGLVIPPTYIVSYGGIDYVRLKTTHGLLLVPVQRGGAVEEGVEIISGVQAGDVLLDAGD